MSLLRWTPLPDGHRRTPGELGYAYRVVDQAAWQGWLDALSGHAGSRLEVDHRRLRIVDVGAPPVPVTARPHVPVPYAARAMAPALRRPPAAAPAPAAPPAAPAATPAAAPVAGPGGGRARRAAAAAAPVDPVLAEVTTIVARDDRLPGRAARPRPRPRGRPGRRHGQAGRGVRRGARALRRRARRRTCSCATSRRCSHVAGWVRDKTGMRRVRAPAAAPAAPAPRRRLPRLPAPVAAAPAAGRPGAGRGDRDRRRDDRLPGRAAGPRPRPGGRPRRRHGQAGRGVRRGARHYDVERDENLQLRDFPTLQPRGRLGARQDRHGRRSCRAAAAGPGAAAPWPPARCGGRGSGRRRPGAGRGDRRSWPR